MTDRSVLMFKSSERHIAPKFDVSEIEAVNTSIDPPAWIPVEPPLGVSRLRYLRRDEWLMRGAVGPTLGVDPHTQLVGPVGSANSSSVASATVLAGVLFESGAGGRIAVYTSPSAPLNIDIATDAHAVDDVLAMHTSSQRPNAG